MDTNTIITIGMFIPIIIGLAAILKFLFQMKNEMNQRLNHLEIEVVKINGRFDKIENDNTKTNHKIDKNEEVTNKRIDRVEDFNKNIVTQVLDKINIQTGQPVIN